MQCPGEAVWGPHVKNVTWVDWRKNGILWCLDLGWLLEKQRSCKEEA